MSLPAFPLVTAPSDVKWSSKVKKISSKPEDGPVMARPAWTKAERRAELTWSTFGEDDRLALFAFFETYSCSAFAWTFDGTTYTVMFDPEVDRLDAAFARAYKDGRPGWSGSITLLEV